MEKEIVEQIMKFPNPNKKMAELLEISYIILYPIAYTKPTLTLYLRITF